MDPARVAERGNEQKRLDLDAADLDQAFAKVDLHLLAGPRLKTEQSRASAASSCRYGATARSTVRKLTIDALLGNQFLANHVGIAAMAPEPLSQPILKAAELPQPFRLLVSYEIACIHVPLNRVMAATDPPPIRFAPSRPTIAEASPRPLRLLHDLPPRTLHSHRAFADLLIVHEAPHNVMRGSSSCRQRAVCRVA